MKKLERELKKKENAINHLKNTRMHLIKEASEIALSIAKKKGSVTSNDVILKMANNKSINNVDKRFMGAVFRNGKLWRRDGYVNEGSHGRPISVWKLRAA